MDDRFIDDRVAAEYILDPKFYIESFTRIKSENGGLVPFKLSPLQLHIFNLIEEHDRLCFVKARQLWTSSSIVAKIYHHAITTPGINSAIIAHTAKAATNLLDTIKTMWRTSPETIRPEFGMNSKFEMTFPKIESKILVLPATEELGRSYSFNGIVLASELPFWPNPSTQMSALMPCVHGKLVVESCVDLGTYVITDRGPQKIGWVHDWEKKGKGWSEGKKIKVDGHYGMRDVARYFNSGLREGFEMVLDDGRSLKTSSVHKTFVLRGATLDFVEAKDIRPGDAVPLKIGQDIWGNEDDCTDFTPTEYSAGKKNIVKFNPKKVTTDLAYLVGLLVGDGHLHRTKYAEVHNYDKEVQDFLKSRPLGLNFIETKKIGKVNSYRVTSQSFVEFLRWIGYVDEKAPKKVIPRKVFSWSRENVIAFLSGLFDTDGHSCGLAGSVGLSSTSEEIIDGVNILLTNLGIHFRKNSQLSLPTKRVNVSSLVFTLTGNYFNSRLFYEVIGFRIVRKQKRLLLVDHVKVPGRESIPGLGRWIHKNRKFLGFSVKNFFKSKGFYGGEGNIDNRLANKILSICRNTSSEEYQELSGLLSHGYLFLRVKEMRKYCGQVVDFNVPDGNTVSYNGIIGHQSPNMVGDAFHRMWCAENDFHKEMLGWWWKYTREQYEEKRREQPDEAQFLREYACMFMSSGANVFDTGTLSLQLSNVLRLGDKVRVEGGFEWMVKKIDGISSAPGCLPMDGLTVYRPPVADGVYTVGADVSAGYTEGNYSVISVLDRRNGEQVAFWRGHVAPSRLGEMLYAVGTYYNCALLIPEINNHGISVLDRLKQLCYGNIYFRPKGMETPGDLVSDRLGWKTGPSTRSFLINDYRTACKMGQVTIRSKETYDEMSTFVYDRFGREGAIEGMFDDCVLATAIAFQGFKMSCAEDPGQIDLGLVLPSSGY